MLVYYQILICVVYMNNCKAENHLHIKEILNHNEEYNQKVIEASNIFSLIGEPNRMKIILALLEGELCVYHICEITGGKQSATSQHLRKLKDNKIVKSRKVSNQVLYSIADEHISILIDTVLKHKNCIIK